jgi:hypothetical protein
MKATGSVKREMELQPVSVERFNLNLEGLTRHEMEILHAMCGCYHQDWLNICHRRGVEFTDDDRIWKNELSKAINKGLNV